MPSMSGLALLSNDFIISITCSCPVFPRLNLCFCGSKSFRWFSGLILVGSTVSEIDWPILEKKLLNSSAISFDLDLSSPLTFNSVKLFVLFSPKVVSFKRSHVRFGLFECFLKLSSRFFCLLIRIRELNKLRYFL